MQNEEIVADFANTDLISEKYSQGFLFGRKSAGYLYQTCSLRIDLSKFVPSSENRRVLKKYETNIVLHKLPFSVEFESWKIQKLAVDFYHNKFQAVDFSANKLRELLKTNYHFNLLLDFNSTGYAICYENPLLLHYCYPFYDLSADITNRGMFIMLQAILWAQLLGKEYIYLGGLTRRKDVYKLQFAGVEYWQDNSWHSSSEDIEVVKASLAAIPE